MRKFLGVSFAAILAVMPVIASAADPVTPIAPVTIAANETVGVASTKYVKEAYNAMAGKVNTELAKKQDVIDATHKLDADSVDDTTSTHKFVTAADKTKWDGKQNALSEAQLAAADSGITAAKVSTYDGYADGKANVGLDNLSTTGKANVSAQGTYNASTNYASGTVGAAIKGKQDVIDADHKLAASNVSGLATVATSGKSSDLNNDAGFITKDVNNLTNYTTTTNMNTALNAKVTNEGQFTGNTDSSLIKSKTVVNAIKDTATAVDGKVTNAGQFTANTNSDLIKNKTVVEAIQSTATAVDGKQAALTETQLAAVNSGINSTKVATYDAFATGKQDKLTEGDGIDITNNTIKVDLSANSGLAFDATDKKLELSSATKASLGKADNAVRMVKVNGTALSEGATDGDVNITVATGTGNGTIKVNGADVSVKGLGSAAYTESTAYATSAQGTKADNAAAAIGTGTLNTTATTLIGAVNEVNGKVLTIYSGWNNGGTPGTTSTVTLTTPAS